MKPTSLSSLKNLSNLKRKLDTNQAAAKRLEELDIADVYSEAQPRKQFLLIEELAQSMKEIGQQQPIVVNPDGKGKYVIEQGERRYRAAKLAGFSKIEAVVKHSEKDFQRTVRQLTENMQRDDMKLGELSESIHSLVEAGMSIRDLAKQLGKKESYISTLNACSELPAILQNLVDGMHIKDPVSLRRLKIAYQDHPDEVAHQVGQWSNAPVSDVSAVEDSEAATFVVTRAQVNAFVASLRGEVQAQPVSQDGSDFATTDVAESFTTPAHSAEAGLNEAEADVAPVPVPTPISSPSEPNTDAPTEKATDTFSESGSKKFNLDETFAGLPEGYARCSSTDFRVYVSVKGLGEGYLTPNVIPPKGKISVTLLSDGKIAEFDPPHVTITTIGTKHKNART